MLSFQLLMGDEVNKNLCAYQQTVIIKVVWV